MPKRKKWLLSVDWDTFIPENPDLDFGHAETLMFATFAWLTRGYAYKKLKLTGEERTFWDRVEKKTKYKSTFPAVFVSDSHSMMHSLLNTFEIDLVALVDAHHDAWPVACKDGDYASCADWLRIWLEQNKKHRAHWVQPKWSLDLYETPTDLASQFKHTSLPKMEKLLPAYAPVAIHICRSASWTPPWLDAAFIKFVNNTGLYHSILQQEGWLDPMEERWQQGELRQMLQMQKHMEAMTKGFVFDHKTGRYKKKNPPRWR